MMTFGKITYLAAAVAIAVAIYGTYEMTKKHYLSKSSLSFYRSFGNEVRSVSKIMRFSEEHYSSTIYQQLDCDVYATYYSAIMSHRRDLKNPQYIISEEDAMSAQRVLDEAMEDLSAYKDRHGIKDCGSATIIVGVG